MLKKTITYTDYEGVERTEDFYFNLTEAELSEMELTTVGGMSKSLEKMVAAKDTPAVLRIFKDIMLKAYGEKSADGRRFKKSEELSQEFTETEAYSVLFMEICSDQQKMTDFILGVMPEKVRNKAAVEMKNNPALAKA